MSGKAFTFEELYAQAEDYFCDMRKMSDGTWFAYSNILRKTTFEGDPDPYVRAPGATPRLALAQLVALVDLEQRTQ